MRYSSFRIGESKLAYNTRGEGAQVLLLFHGFGQSKLMYDELPDVILDNYRVIAIDLFGHGDSTFYHEKRIDIQEWGSFVASILEKENVANFSILGFSLGAKVAIHTAYLLRERVDKLVLLAPDGVVKSIVYELATHNRVFEKLFYWFVFNPWFYQKAIIFFKSIRLIDAATAEFFLRVLHQKSRRYKLYRVWNMYSEMRLSFHFVVSHLKIKPIVFLAKKDVLIQNNAILKLCQSLDVKTEVLYASHFGVVEVFFKSRANLFARTD